MAKKAVSWIELMNILIKERKSKKQPAGVSDVIDEAQKLWKLIKSGQHEKFIQGKPPKRKTKKNKLSKKAKKTRSREMKALLKKCKLKVCDSCQREIDKCLS